MSKIIPFNVKFRPQIESGDYKVETRDGKPVRIICWDMDSYNHIVALVANYPNYNGSLSEHIFSYGMDGRYSIHAENAEDLFIVTPEPEMSEFEQEVHAVIDEQIEEGRGLKEIAAELLDFAKQQLLQSGELLTQEHHEKLMETLREECKKDLPRWKKSDRDLDAGTIDFAVFHKNDGGDHEDWLSVEVTNRLYKDEYYLELAELEKLPQEDESNA